MWPVSPYLNYLRHKLGSRNRIIGLRFTVTWRCDSHCQTCAIWKTGDTGITDLTLPEIDRFSNSKYFRHTEYITLSGGEPTLRDDLPEIVSILHRNIPSATFGMTTNGNNPDKIEKIFTRILSENPKIRFKLLGISLNGPAKRHDKTRGVQGSWQRAIETYTRLKNLVHTEFSFTFCKDNTSLFDWTQCFAKCLGTKAYICWTVMNDRFNATDKDLVFWQPGMEKVLEEHLCLSNTWKSKLKGIFFPRAQIVMVYLYDSIINRRKMPCFAGSQIVHVTPSGDIYPCNFKLTSDRLLGNLREKCFDDIWEGTPHRILREIDCGECQYPNGLCGDSDIAPSIANSPPLMSWWCLKKLLRRRSWIEQLGIHGKNKPPC